jgi:hypothetical protein
MREKEVSYLPFPATAFMAAGAVYLVASIVMTYPLPLRWSREVAGPPEDNLLGLWTLWWVKKAIVELHQSPLWTQYLYWPNGASLAFHTFSHYNALLAIPIQSLFNRVETYNLLWFSSFPLSAVGGFLLAYELTGNIRGSFLAGWIFSFCAYHFAHGEHHLNLTSIQWIPWYAWGLIRLSRRPTNGVGILCGIFFVASALCSWYYAVFLAIFTLIWTVVEGRKVPSSLRRSFALAVGVSLAGVLPLALPMIIRMINEPWSALSEPNPLRHGGDLLGYVMPYFGHSILRETGLISGFYENMGPFPWESVVFLGVVPLGLSTVALLKEPKDKWALWAVSFAIFWVFSLGPDLRLQGKVILGHMPYEWMIQNVPVLRMVRVPGRFVIMCMLSLSVLSAMGYSSIEGRFSKKWRIPLMSFFVLFLSLEGASFPLRMTDPYKISNARLFEPLKEDLHGKAILELPMRGYVFNLVYLYRQTIHEKRLLFGAMSRIGEKATQTIREGPLLNFFIPQRAIDKGYVEEMIRELRDLDVGYIVMNENFFKIQGPEALQAMERLKEGLKANQNVNLYLKEDGLSIYRVALPAEQGA